LDPAADLVLYCGTLPLVTGGFVHGQRYEMALHVPERSTLSHTYHHGAHQPRDQPDTKAMHHAGVVARQDAVA
jgi:hypothetical protein